MTDDGQDKDKSAAGGDQERDKTHAAEGNDQDKAHAAEGNDQDKTHAAEGDDQDKTHAAKGDDQDKTHAAGFTNPAPDVDNGAIINDWLVLDQLGKGVFGAVVKCKRANAKHADQNAYAMKIEQAGGQVELLALEVEVYNALMAKRVARRHFPAMIAHGHWNTLHYIVMTLVGPSLQELRNQRPGCKFTMGTALVIARQTLEALLQLHRVGYLHRDIKPANFTIGRGPDADTLFVLDFGMARKFVKEEGGVHVLRRPRIGQVGFRGTLKYASTVAHRGQELCRGDDIESWFYLVCELIKGRLPWHKHDNPKTIYGMKLAAKKPPPILPDVEGGTPPKSPRRLLLGGCPRQFGPMLDAIAAVKYYNTPPYEQLANHIDDAIRTTRATKSPLDWQRTAKQESAKDARGPAKQEAAKDAAR